MELTGIEASFVTSWEEWNEVGCGGYYFYNVTLKPDVFPFPIEGDVVYDLSVDTEFSIVEVFAPQKQDAPVFTSKFKVVLI